MPPHKVVGCYIQSLGVDVPPPRLNKDGRIVLIQRAHCWDWFFLWLLCQERPDLHQPTRTTTFPASLVSRKNLQANLVDLVGPREARGRRPRGIRTSRRKRKRRRRKRCVASRPSALRTFTHCLAFTDKRREDNSQFYLSLRCPPNRLQDETTEHDW